MRRLPVVQQRSLTRELTAALDPRVFRALGEQARIDVLMALIELGTCDIETVAARLPQDRSVISRHLAQLEEAGLLTSTRDGRRRLYALDGPSLLATFDRIHAAVRRVVAQCCPPDDGAAS